MSRLCKSAERNPNPKSQVHLPHLPVRVSRDAPDRKMITEREPTVRREPVSKPEAVSYLGGSCCVLQTGLLPPSCVNQLKHVRKARKRFLFHFSLEKGYANIIRKLILPVVQLLGNAQTSGDPFMMRPIGQIECVIYSADNILQSDQRESGCTIKSSGQNNQISR